jgi:trimeric autotransporter adhesin
MDKNTTMPSEGMTSAAADVKDDVPAKSNVAADVNTTMPDTITAGTSDSSSSSNGASRNTASTSSTRLLPARLRQAPVTFVPTFQGSFVRRRPGSATDVTVNQEEQAHDSGNSSGSNSSNQPYAAAQQRSQLRAPQRSRQLRGNNSTAIATTTGDVTSGAAATAKSDAAAAVTADTDVSDSRVSAVDSDDELISEIINNSKYAGSGSSSATKSNTDVHKKQQHLKSDKVKVSQSRVGDLYQAVNIPPCRSAGVFICIHIHGTL